MKRVLCVGGLVALLGAAAVGPALANNDPFTPADTCSGNTNVVGQPDRYGNINATGIVTVQTGIDNPVGPGGASASNPGVSTGAQGQLNAGPAPGQCAVNP
jgi:hypothetical protein